MLSLSCNRHLLPSLRFGETKKVPLLFHPDGINLLYAQGGSRRILIFPAKIWTSKTDTGTETRASTDTPRGTIYVHYL